MSSISLCMISFNEAALIADAIRSCQGVVDEIILVDHHSTDGTAEVAQRCGAKVIQRAWTDSYADARNAGIAAATGDWLFALDCDERLEPSSREIFRPQIAAATADALTITLIDENAGGESRATYLRLARRLAMSPLIRRIHERPSRPFNSIGQTSIQIRHIGHRQPITPAKQQRYLRLLELQLAETPDDHYLQVDYLYGLWQAQDPRWEPALEHASQGLDQNSPRPQHALITSLLEVLMRRDRTKAPAAISPEIAADLAARWYPAYPPLISLRIYLLLEKKNHAAALELSSLAFNVLARTDLPASNLFDRNRVTANLHMLTAVAHSLAGSKSQAIHHLQLASQHPDWTTQAQKNLEILRSRG